LLDGPRSQQWRRLDLSGNHLRRRDLVDLVDSPAMRNLVALDLMGNPLGDGGATVLADSPNAAGLVALGLCGTGTGNEEVAALANSRHLTSLRGLDIRGHHCWLNLDRDREDQGGVGALARSPLLSQLRRLLLSSDGLRRTPASSFGTARTSEGPSNGWTAEVLDVVRSPRRLAVVRDSWTSGQLRKARYLMPSQLIECDLEEVWWLGDTGSRDRVPVDWDV
jgi:hypothetical protein